MHILPLQSGNGTMIVLPLERFFQTLKAIHENSGHARITTMWKKVCIWIIKVNFFIEFLINFCNNSLVVEFSKICPVTKL